jgi:hypothetical protein
VTLNSILALQRSWQLLTYANDIAYQLAGGSYQIFTSKYHPGRVLEFVDIEALEYDGQASSDAYISDSRMSSSSGDHSDSDGECYLVSGEQ